MVDIFSFHLISKFLNLYNKLRIMPVPIEIVFLGTGCGIPTLQRHHPAILLRYEGDYMLFDCGEACQLGLLKAGISPMRIQRIFITHWHADHFAGLLPLIETLHLSERKEPLEIYAPEASRFISAMLELSYWSFGFEIVAKDVDPYEKRKILETERYEIFSLPVKHSVPSVGYMFKEKDHWNINVKKAKKLGLKGKILQEMKEKGKVRIDGRTIKLEEIAKKREGRKVIYSGDTLPCEELFAEAKGALLIHDSTFIEPKPERMHASAIEVARLAKKYGVKKLVLTHFSRRYKSEKEILKVVKPIFSQVIAARDLKRIKF
jgi:ribonuclease Z